MVCVCVCVRFNCIATGLEGAQPGLEHDDVDVGGGGKRWRRSHKVIDLLIEPCD